MKKFLLFASAALLGLSANAELPYQVLYNGEPVTDGQEITVSVEKEDITPEIAFYTAALDLVVQNQGTAPLQAFIDAYAVDPELDVMKNYGFTICYNHGGINGDDQNCLMSSNADILYATTTVLGGSAIKNFEWQCHFSSANPETHGKVKLVLGTATMGATAPEEGTSFTCYFIAEKYGSDAVESLDAENTPARYFDLQGHEVSNPQAGLYVVRRGDKTTKEFIR